MVPICEKPVSHRNLTFPCGHFGSGEGRESGRLDSQKEILFVGMDTGSLLYFTRTEPGGECRHLHDLLGRLECVPTQIQKIPTTCFRLRPTHQTWILLLW